MKRAADWKFQPDRLLKLADLLMADAKRKNGIKFDLGNWGDVSDPENILSCGTTACAFGLAALSGAFKRVGLGYELDYPKRDYTNSRDFQEIAFRWKGRPRTTTSIAMELFGLTESESDALFGGSPGPDCSVSRGAEAERAVAKRIRKLVKAVQKLKKGESRDLAVSVLD
jgi:hypothetical protein